MWPKTMIASAIEDGTTVVVIETATAMPGKIAILLMPIRRGTESVNANVIVVREQDERRIGTVNGTEIVLARRTVLADAIPMMLWEGEGPRRNHRGPHVAIPIGLPMICWRGAIGIGVEVVLMTILINVVGMKR